MARTLAAHAAEDPSYITNHNNARVLIRQIDRDDLLRAMVKGYFVDES